MPKPSPVRFYAYLLFAALLSACGTQPAKPQAADAATPKPAETAGAAADPLAGLSALELKLDPVHGITQDILYAILVAEFAGQRGQYEAAQRTYLRLMRELNIAAVAERAARIASFTQDQPATLDAAQRWVELDSFNIEARLLLAMTQIESGNMELALPHLDTVLNSLQGTANQRNWAVANALTKLEDKNTALTVMEQLLLRNGRDADALFAYALLSMRAGQAEKSFAAMQEVLDKSPQQMELVSAYLSLLQQQGAGPAARDWLEKTVNQYPHNADLRLAYARLLTDDKDYAAARKQFARVEKAQPNNADVQYAQALLSLQSNNDAEAQRRFKKLVKLGEHAEEARYYLGQIAENKNQYAAAEKWYAEVNGGEYALEAKLRLAILLSKQKKLAEAQAALHAIAPENPEQGARIARAEAELLAEAGKAAEAVLIYDDLIAREGETSELLYARAMMAERAGNLDILERDLKRLLEKEPENTQALNALGYTLADRTTRYQEAYDYIKKAIDLGANDYYVLDSMGWVLFKLGRLEEAIDFLRRAQQQKNDPEVAAHLGEVLWAKGQKTEARKLWSRAKKIAPDNQTLNATIDRFGL